MTVEVCREESFAGTRLSLEQHRWQPPSARQLSEQSVDLLTYHLRCVAFTDKGDHGSQLLLCLLFGPCGAESERPRFDDVASASLFRPLESKPPVAGDSGSGASKHRHESRQNAGRKVPYLSSQRAGYIESMDGRVFRLRHR